MPPDLDWRRRNGPLAAAGVPDHIRTAWCGHTVAVNVATYTHARPEDPAIAGDMLGRICGAVSSM